MMLLKLRATEAYPRYGGADMRYRSSIDRGRLAQRSMCDPVRPVDALFEMLVGSSYSARRHHGMESCMSEALHPSAPHDLPSFITAPGDTDILMVVVGIVLIAAILGVGNLYLRLHSLPEQMAHKSQKLQFEIVAVLGLLALFTHNHLFWVIGLLLALVDLPDFGTPLRSIAGSVDKIAGVVPEEGPTKTPNEATTHAAAAEPGAAKGEVPSHV
jgi:hypothetical protein